MNNMPTKKQYNQSLAGEFKMNQIDPPQPSATVEEAAFTRKDMLECYKASNTVWDKDQMDGLEAEFNEWLSNYTQSKPEPMERNLFITEEEELILAKAFEEFKKERIAQYERLKFSNKYIKGFSQGLADGFNLALSKLKGNK